MNDSFAAATAQSGSFWLASGTLHEATSEANEPILNGYPNGQTAWWKWTATATGTFRVRTWGSEADVMLGLYRGTSLDDLRLISYASSHFERSHSAQANMDVVSGTTYYIQVLGTDNLSPVATADALLPSRVQLSLTRVSGAVTPSNDSFAAATVLSGANTEVTASNSQATSEAGEPLGISGNAGNTIWFSWTAPSTGTFNIDTQRGDFDSIVAVYTGNAVNSLTRIDYASDTFSLALGQAFGGGRVNFKATSGTTYRFQLQGAVVNGLSEHGVCRLLLQPVTPPANDDFANATVLSGSAPSGDGWTTYATPEAGEPAAAMDESKSIWWSWTAPSTGVLAVAMMEGKVEPFTGASVNALTLLPTDPRSGTRPTLGAVTIFYQVASGTVVRLRGGDEYNRVRFSLRMIQSPAHDDFANRLLLSGASATNTTDLEFASWQQNEPGTDGLGPPTVWYKWVAPSTARYVIDSSGSVQFNRVKVFTGTVLDSLVGVGTEKIGSNSGNTFGRIILDAASGTEYAIQLRRENNYNGNAKLNIHAIAPPANDNFANAINMTGSSWTANGTNVDASREEAAFEPIPGLSDPYASSTVWWKWTAPATGRYRVSLAGSSFDSVLGIYTGTAIGSLTNVAKDQSGGWNSSGAVFLNATNGTQYFFQVDGNSFQEGSVQLSLATAVTPPNDAFANRLVLSGAAVTASGSVTAATAEAGQPVAGGANAGRSVWYEWTAPSSGKALIRVTAPRFSPAWGLYSGSAVNGLTEFISAGSGAPSASEATTQFAYSVSSGSSYKIQVDGNPSDTGNFTISITMSAAPLNDNFAARTLISGNVVRSSSDNVGAKSEASEPVHAGSAAANSVWWEWTAPATGQVTLDTNGSTASPRLAVYTGSALVSLSPVASAATASPFTTLSFTAVAGTSYKIAADSTDTTRGLIVLNLVAAAAAPANDNFANAIVWNADQGESLVFPRGASAEASEPAPGGRAAAKSLWWAWTPQTTRHARIWMETETTGLLARLAVYRGSALNSLTPITAQTSDAHWGRLEFDAIAGETYRIVVDTPSIAVDPGWVKFGVVPVNGNSDNAYLFEPTASPFSVSTTGAYEVDSVQAPTARRTLWWAWQPDVCARMEWSALGAAGSGTSVSVSTLGSGQPVPGSGEVTMTFDVVPDQLYFFSVSTVMPGPLQVQLREAPAQAPPANDRYYSALPMSGSSWSVPVTLGTETENRLYWRWTAPATGIAEVKLDGTLAESDALLAFADGYTTNMTAGASRTNGGSPVLRLASTIGQQWLFVSQSGLRRTRAATLSLVSPAAGASPANDNWENAQVLAASFGTINGDITNASCQPLEPDHSNSNGTGSATQFPPGRSVWYDWTPSVTGPVSLRLQSSASLALQLYRGSTRQQWLTSGFLPPGAPAFTANVVAGQTYHIAVATRPYNETTSTFALSLGGPANDLFSNATTLSGSNATNSVESSGATIETGEPGYSTNANPSKASLWWKWTAPNGNGVWVDTLGSEYDTVLTVFTTDPPTIPAILTENDNASTLPGAGASMVAFKPVAAQTYWFRVTRAAGDTGVSGIARINLSSTAPIADPWQRWLAANPTLSGPTALDTADPDKDGVSNLMELALGSNPLAGTLFPITQTITPQGFQVEALLDRTALSGLSGTTPIDASWQVSYDLKTWLPGPTATIVGTQGKLTRERIVLPWNGPRFARLAVTRTH